MQETSKEQLALAEEKEAELSTNADETDLVPRQYICSLSKDIMKDPVIALDGHTYEREWIERWLAENETSPNTREPMTNLLIPNRALRTAIEEHQLVQSKRESQARLFDNYKDCLEQRRKFVQSIVKFHQELKEHILDEEYKYMAQDNAICGWMNTSLQFLYKGGDIAGLSDKLKACYPGMPETAIHFIENHINDHRSLIYPQGDSSYFYSITNLLMRGKMDTIKRKVEMPGKESQENNEAAEVQSENAGSFTRFMKQFTTTS